MEETKPRERVSADEFIKRLNAAGLRGIAAISDLEIVNDFVALSDKNIEFTSQIQIHNCLFPTSLLFNNLTKPESILIKNCEANYISIKNITLSRPSLNLYLGSITLSGVTIRNGLDISGSNISSDIIIADNSNIQKLSISESEIGRGIYLINSTVSVNIGLSKVKTNSYLAFDGAAVTGQVSIYNCEFTLGILCSKGSSFEEPFSILDSIHKNKTEDKSPVLTLTNCDFKKTFSITYLNTYEQSGFNHINIAGCSFESGLQINGQSPSGRIRINSITISCSKLLRGELFFGNLSIDNTYITGQNFDSFLIFNNVVFKKITFDYFSNEGNFQFINSKGAKENDSVFKLENSNLGKMQFLNWEFTNFTKISIRNSDLTTISTSSVKWFEYEQINRGTDTYIQKRELFRQLKFAMEKQGDRIQSLVFKRYEMKAYKEELNFSKRRIAEKSIMFFNQSNNYGQNWLKPLLILLSLNVVFYLLLTITQSPRISWTPGTNISFIGENIRTFFLILNPAHNIDNLFGEHVAIPWQVYPIDLIYRIILSYLIFQTISAFRKYVK